MECAFLCVMQTGGTVHFAFLYFVFDDEQYEECKYIL